MKATNHLKKSQAIFLGLVTAFLLPVCWFLFYAGVQLQPSRPSDLGGWRAVDFGGGGSTYIGSFVLQKGESTDNGGVGVQLLGLASKACPPAAICLEPVEAQARLRFYRPSDRSVMCETTLEANSTSYVAERVCGGELPFTNINVEAVNTRENWAVISLFNVAEKAQVK